MKKFIIITLAIFSFGILTATADHGRIIAKENLPQKAQQFIKQYFGNVKIAYAKEERGFIEKGYEVMLADGVKLEFSRNGEWKEVDCRRSSVPTPIIPAPIMKYVKEFVPLARNFPAMINGIIGALIIWPLMKKTKTDGYLDRKTINNVAGLSLEIVIVSAISTLKLSVLGDFILPILIMSVVCLGVTLAICLWLSKKISTESWFEKCVTHFGQASGAVPTGLALLRCVDPHNETSVTDSVGVQNSLMSPFYTIMSAVGPMMLMASIFNVIGLGAVLFLAGLIAARIFLWNKRG